MNTIIKTAAIASLLTGTLLLASCTAAPSETAPAPESTVLDAPTDVDTEALNVGDEGDAVEAKALRNSATKTGYELPDGTVVVVEAAKPLPEKVLNQVTESIEAIPQPSEAPSVDDRAAAEASYEALEAFGSEVLSQSYATGKELIVIRYVPTSTMTDNLMAWVPMTYTSGFPVGVISQSADELKKTVDAWIAEQENPDVYEVIIIR